MTKLHKKPLVSVLMPAYNSQEYLAESIESILAQTYTNFELLIADDASTDNTYKIAKSYESTDPRVRVFQNKKNINIAENRNFLISKALGEYIAWQDADDISVPDRLSWQVDFLIKNPRVGIVGGYLEIFDKSGKTQVRKYAANDAQLRKTIFRYSPVAQPAAMLRKQALVYAGEYGKDLSPAEDIDMSFRIGTKYEFANLQKVVLQYRNYAESATYKKLRKIELVTLSVRAKYMFSQRYTFSLFDFVYNFLQFVSVFIVPAKVKIRLFNLLRNG